MPKVVSSEPTETEYRKRPARGASLFVSETSLEHMIDHADCGFGDGVEIMGLMMGTVYRDDLGYYAMVMDAVTSELDSDEVSVRFGRNSFEELFKNIDKVGGKVVGWYHSHPGFGCYLSDTDIRTHKGIFGNDPGFAIVIDPSDATIKAFTVENEEQKDAVMVIMDAV